MMSKILLIAILLVAVGVLTGVLEVTAHPERLATAPSTIIGMVHNGSLLERGRALLVSGKRWFELYSAQEEDQKMEVRIGFIREDAERLEKLVAEQANPQKIIPQAELLAKSVEQAQKQAADLSEGQLANIQSISEEAFNQANTALAHLEEFQQNLAEGADALKSVAENIEVPSSEEDGEVAGTQDSSEAEEAPKEESQSKVPLRF